MGPSSADREARAWLLELSDPAFLRGFGQHCGSSRAGGSDAVNSLSGVRSAERPARGRSEVPAPFRVVVLTEGDVVRVCPFGEVDLDTVEQIREQLEHATATGPRYVVLDLSGVTFMDSAGLHLVLEADAASRAQRWEFELIGGPADVQRVFDLTGARPRLPFVTASELAVLLTVPGEAPA